MKNELTHEQLQNVQGGKAFTGKSSSGQSSTKLVNYNPEHRLLLSQTEVGQAEVRAGEGDPAIEPHPQG